MPTKLPEASNDGDVVLVGQPWPGWNPAAVVVVVRAKTEVREFTIFDTETAEEYQRATGSDIGTPEANAKVQLLSDGLGIVGPNGDVEKITFGTPLDRARARIARALGAPTDESPPPRSPESSCSFASVHWDELSLSHTRETFYGWVVGATRANAQTGEFEPVAVRGIAETPEGISLGSTIVELQYAYPGDQLQETLVNGGRLASYRDSGERNYTIVPREAQNGIIEIRSRTAC